MERYSRLFSNNAAPEPAEVTAIQEDIDALNKTIDQLELEMQGFDDQLKRIEAKRRRVERERRRVQGKRNKVAAERDTRAGLLTPLRRYPLEILSEIFVTVCDAAGIDNKAGPVVDLCRVCRSWRNAAIGTPQLWSRLKLSETDLDGCDINKISRWFARSGSVARSLELEDLRCDIDHLVETDGCGPLISSKLVELLTRGPLLHELFLNMIDPICLRNIAKGMKDTELEGPVARPWNSLQQLRIGIPFLFRSRMPPPLSVLLLDLPSVPSFHMLGFWDAMPAYYWRYPTTNTTIENLTQLITEDLPIASALKLLALSSNVQDLTMTCERFGDSLSTTIIRQPILLQQLRALRLKCWSCKLTTSILSLLRTPSLADFRYTFSSPNDEDEEEYSSDSSNSQSDDWDDDSDFVDPSTYLFRETVPDCQLHLIDGLTSFFRQSEASLRILHVGGLDLPSGGLERLLVALPSLAHLALDCISVDNSPLRSAYDLALGNCPDLLPHLESLRVSDVSDLFSYEGVCDFCAYRATCPMGIKKIKTLTLEIGPMSFQEYDTMPLNDLRKDVAGLRELGMDVYVSRYHSA